MTEWFRSPEWTNGAAAEFELRLARARLVSRAQYLRIQAVTLLGSDRPEDIDAAAELLRRLIREYPESSEVPFAHEQLGEAYRRTAELGLAERHLRVCIELVAPRFSGVGQPLLTLAEVLAERGGAERIAEAIALLYDIEPRLVFHSEWFRWFTLAATVMPSDSDRRVYAQKALDLLNAPPQFSRHRTVGVVEADESTIAHLRRLAAR